MGAAKVSFRSIALSSEASFSARPLSVASAEGGSLASMVTVALAPPLSNAPTLGVPNSTSNVSSSSSSASLMIGMVTVLVVLLPAGNVSVPLVAV